MPKEWWVHQTDREKSPKLTLKRHSVTVDWAQLANEGAALQVLARSSDKLVGFRA